MVVQSLSSRFWAPSNTPRADIAFPILMTSAITPQFSKSDYITSQSQHLVLRYAVEKSQNSHLVVLSQNSLLLVLSQNSLLFVLSLNSLLLVLSQKSPLVVLSQKSLSLVLTNRMLEGLSEFSVYNAFCILKEISCSLEGLPLCRCICIFFTKIQYHSCARCMVHWHMRSLTKNSRFL